MVTTALIPYTSDQKPAKNPITPSSTSMRNPPANIGAAANGNSPSVRAVT